MGEYLGSLSTRPSLAGGEGVGVIGSGMSEFREERTVDSRVAFQGRHINVRVDTVRLANGRLTTREIVDGSNSVCIVPVDDRGNVFMVRQYRKAIERHILEVPAGAMDDGEEPEAAARRELREETGFGAEKLEFLSFFWTTPGYCTEGMYAYLATGLSLGDIAPDEDENIEVVKVALKEVPSMIASGDIVDCKSIASLMLALSRY